MWLYVYKPLKVSHHPAKFGGHRQCGIGVIDSLILSRDSARSRDQSAMRIYGWELLVVSHHSAVSGGHMHCGGKYIIYLLLILLCLRLTYI